MKYRKLGIYFYLAAAAAAVLSAFLVWERWGSRTEVALVNFNVITQMQMSGANDCSSVVLEAVEPGDFRRLGRFDMVLVSGMGLKLTGEQRTELAGISEKVPVLTVMATDPANNINSLDSERDSLVRTYLDNGGAGNYGNLFLYIRKEIDMKRFRSPEPGAATAFVEGLLYDPTAGGK